MRCSKIPIAYLGRRVEYTVAKDGVLMTMGIKYTEVIRVTTASGQCLQFCVDGWQDRQLEVDRRGKTHNLVICWPSPKRIHKRASLQPELPSICQGCVCMCRIVNSTSDSSSTPLLTEPVSHWAHICAEFSGSLQWQQFDWVMTLGSALNVCCAARTGHPSLTYKAK